MKTRIIVGLIVVGTLGAIGHDASGQPDKPVGGGDAGMAKMLATMSAPAKQHEALEMLSGDWKAEAALLMPGMPPLRAAGTGKGQWVLGKRFMQVASTCTSPGGEMTTESLSFYGFDTRTGKYTLVGMDTLGTYYITAAGDYDATTSTFTLHGEEKQGAMTMKFEWILHRASDTRLVSEVRLDLGGKMTKVAEMVLTR